MKWLKLAVCFLALCFISGRGVYACSCAVASSTDIEAMGDAEFSRRFLGFDGAVFEGRVVKNARAVSSTGGSRAVTFEVERYWKGDGAKRVVVYTATSGAACGVSYEVGRKYLVVAAKLRGDLQTNLCAHLGANKSRATLLKRLGKGERPKS